MEVTTLSDSQKLDFLINSMVEVQKTQATIVQLVTRVNALETRVTEQDKIIAAMKEEIKVLKDHDNTRDLQSRGNALRLFHFPGSDSETNLATKVYDKLLKPILAAAKAKGDLATLPQVGNTIENIFRAGRFAAGANKPPPPIIIKFTSQAIRLAILKNKRNNIPPPTDNLRRMALTEDLSPASHRKLRELLENEKVEKAWTINGSIWFLTKEPNAKPKQVKSVFDPIEKIIQ